MSARIKGSARRRKTIAEGSEEYREIVIALCQGDRTVQSIAKEHGVRRMIVHGIAKLFEQRMDGLQGTEALYQHLATVTMPRAVLAIDAGLVDPAMYPCAKVGVSVAKGRGVFNNPEDKINQNLTVNHNETLIVQNFNNLTLEERNEFLEMARKARLALPGADGVLAGDDGPADSHPLKRDLVGA